MPNVCGSYRMGTDKEGAMLRTSDNYENIQRQKANEIQKFAAQNVKKTTIDNTKARTDIYNEGRY